MSLRERFDLVIFDWAGTMVDFGCQAPVAALIEAFRAEHLQIDDAAARCDMGKSKADHVRAILEQPAVSSQWFALTGRTAGAEAVELLMRRLEPLMRQHAASAATLIPGARQVFDSLRAMGMRVGSSTGYTREMMQPVIARAAEQGYTPEHLVCSGETPAGRPTPLMIYKACAELGIWPLSRVVKVDDAEAGIEEGRAAGVFTVGVTSGNLVGLPLEAFQALPLAERLARSDYARRRLVARGADIVIDSVADLIPALSNIQSR